MPPTRPGSAVPSTQAGTSSACATPIPATMPGRPYRVDTARPTVTTTATRAITRWLLLVFDTPAGPPRSAAAGSPGRDGPPTRPPGAPAGSSRCPGPPGPAGWPGPAALLPGPTRLPSSPGEAG